MCSSKAGSAKKDARESTQTPPIVSAKEDLDRLNDLFRGSSLKKLKGKVGGRSAYLQGTEFITNKHRVGNHCSGADVVIEKKSTAGLKLSNIIQTIRVDGHTGIIAKDSKLGRIYSQLEGMVQEQ